MVIYTPRKHVPNPLSCKWMQFPILFRCFEYFFVVFYRLLIFFIVIFRNRGFLAGFDEFSNSKIIFLWFIFDFINYFLGLIIVLLIIAGTYSMLLSTF